MKNKPLAFKLLVIALSLIPITFLVFIVVKFEVWRYGSASGALHRNPYPKIQKAITSPDRSPELPYF